MKQKISLLIFSSCLMYCADVYDISIEDYNKYKSNPDAMLKIFVEKYTINSSDLNATQSTSRLTESNQIVSVKPVLYSKALILEKLTLSGMYGEVDVDILSQSIEAVLVGTSFAYDIKDISFVLKQIKLKEISPFESNIYLDQISKIIKG